MTDLPQRIVEAAARATFMRGWVVADGMSEPDLFRLRKKTDPDVWKMHLANARAAFRAALALAEAQGVVLVRVPTQADQWDSPGYDHGTPPNIIWADGHNACRAATLAGRVTL